jgi:hypothetical protein
MEWWSDGDYPQKAGDPVGRVPITRVIPIATRYSHLLVRPPGQNAGRGVLARQNSNTRSVYVSPASKPLFTSSSYLCALCVSVVKIFSVPSAILSR